MKLHGDVPQEYKDLAKDLLDQEEFFDSALSRGLPKETIAQAYVSMSHDWYEMGVEEKGNELLAKAADACEDYFNKVMPLHMDEDPTFKMLVDNIYVNLHYILLNNIKERT